MCLCVCYEFGHGADVCNVRLMKGVCRAAWSLRHHGFVIVKLWEVCVYVLCVPVYLCVCVTLKVTRVVRCSEFGLGSVKCAMSQNVFVTSAITCTCRAAAHMSVG